MFLRKEEATPFLTWSIVEKPEVFPSLPICHGADACRLIKESVSQWGTVDVLVNNAGITRDTLVMRMKPEQWQSVIDTNLSAVFYASQVTCSCKAWLTG